MLTTHFVLCAVLELQDRFYACKNCDKLYWEGPKSNSAFDHFQSLFDGMTNAGRGQTAVLGLDAGYL